MSDRKNNFELMNRRRSSVKSSNNTNHPRASLTSSGDTSPIPTIASRSSTQSVVLVRAPSFLSPKSSRKVSKSESQRSDRSNRSNKSDRSKKSDQSNENNSEKCNSYTKRPPSKRQKTLTSSFLRKKRIEYTGMRD